MQTFNCAKSHAEDNRGAIGDGVRLTLDKLHPLSDALTTALQVDIPLNATGEVGIQNFGK